MITNHLTLSTKKEEDQADDILSALTVIGTPLKERSPDEKPVTAKPRRHHRSKFFYTPTTSFIEEVQDRKKEAQNPVLDIMDAEVEKRKAEYAKEFPPQLSKFIILVREFFLKEIGPRTLAAQAGSSQAKEVVQRLLDTEIDNKPFAQFERMLTEANRIKMARYIAQYMKLPQTVVSQLLNSTAPQKEIYFPVPTNEERRAPAPKNKQQFDGTEKVQPSTE